jgi:hypothetical protein
MNPIRMRAFGVIVAMTLSGTAWADGSTTHSSWSDLSVHGSAQIVAGSVDVLSGGGLFVIQSIQVSGDVTEMVLRDAAKASEVTIHLSAEAAGAGSLAVGKVVEVSTLAAGQVLVSAGKVVAFIPNEVGKALFQHSRRGDPAS